MANKHPDPTQKVDWTDENLLKARTLRQQGFRDAAIGRVFGVTGTRIAQKIGKAPPKKKPIKPRRKPKRQKKWTAARIIQTAQRWDKKYGSLSASDWSPYMLRRLGHEDRLQRFYEFGAPHTRTVWKCFGSWSEMKRQAGLATVSRGRRFR